MTLSNVVLPHPDGPTSMSNSPMRASKSTCLSTSVRLSPEPNPLFTPVVLTAIFFIREFQLIVTRRVLMQVGRTENSASVLHGFCQLNQWFKPRMDTDEHGLKLLAIFWRTPPPYVGGYKRPGSALRQTPVCFSSLTSADHF